MLVAVFAPEVAYRRRDALTLLFPLRGVCVAWMIGARLAQLPHRDWPVRTEGVELPGRQMARIVTAVNGYRLWRQRRVQRRSDTHARRAISGPLAPVTSGLSRSPANSTSRRSGRREFRIGQIPKLTVQVRFPSPPGTIDVRLTNWQDLAIGIGSNIR
jgi:hypothetical protein